jgi:hypothetical protein
MRIKERKRLGVLRLVQAGELSLVKAADFLKLSYRHTKRIAARHREQGDAGLVHAFASGGAGVLESTGLWIW